MYTIYVSHSKDSLMQGIIQESKLQYHNSIIYEPENKDLIEISNFISESQFVIVDLTDNNKDITLGIALGLAVEKNIRLVLIVDKEETYTCNIPNKDIIRYTDRSTISKELSAKIMGNMD